MLWKEQMLCQVSSAPLLMVFQIITEHLHCQKTGAGAQVTCS